MARPKLIPHKSKTAAAPGARRQHVPEPNIARGDMPDFDRVIHERLRLGIISALAVNDALSFTDLKRLLDTTDGNLSVHARKLEDAGYIACNKRFEDRVPRTEYSLTATGKKALEKYLKEMEIFIQKTRSR